MLTRRSRPCRKAAAKSNGSHCPLRLKLGDALRRTDRRRFRAFSRNGRSARRRSLHLQQFRILCALRQGPFGVENLNAIAEEILADAGLLTPRRDWYRGQPIMVTQNDYNLALFNGDSGIVLPDPSADGELRAFFLSAEGKLRRFLPSRLPVHETAFAMTVHKSQGSEFNKSASHPSGK